MLNFVIEMFSTNNIPAALSVAIASVTDFADSNRGKQKLKARGHFIYCLKTKRYNANSDIKQTDWKGWKKMYIPTSQRPRNKHGVGLFTCGAIISIHYNFQSVLLLYAHALPSIIDFLAVIWVFLGCIVCFMDRPRRFHDNFQTGSSSRPLSFQTLKKLSGADIYGC